MEIDCAQTNQKTSPEHSLFLASSTRHQHMKVQIYLIRHGETVDNIAGLYAGVRDSALTNHGHDQARRLGEFFAKNDVKLTHLFASPLTRAFKTAESIQKSQLAAGLGSDGGLQSSIDIVNVPDLIEQDFGFYEGKPFYVRSDPNKNGKDAHSEMHKSEPGFVDVESKDSMAKRADAFLDNHILPLTSADCGELTIAVVSHGMLLSTLWRRLLRRLPGKSVKIAPEVTAARGALVLEHLGGWSNTGYLGLVMSKDARMRPVVAANDASSLEQAQDMGLALPTAVPTAAIHAEGNAPVTAGSSHDQPAPPTHQQTFRVLHGWSTLVAVVDSKQHLTGLKRQRGGIGRLAHDEGQKKLDSFFKKQRTG